MYQTRPMPLTGGFIPLTRVRGRINMLDGANGEAREQGSGFDFPICVLPPLPDSAMIQPQIKPAPIDLRLHMDLRDVRLYVDVIVDMLLQSLDGHPFAGFYPKNSGLSRQLAANPEARHILEKLLGQVDALKENENLSSGEIIQRLLREAHAAKEDSSELLALPLKLKHFALTHRSPSGQSRTSRRERLVHEARKLVLAQMRFLGYKTEVVTKHKDGDSALRVAVAYPEPEPAYTETAAHPQKQEQSVNREQTAQPPVRSEQADHKADALHPAEKPFRTARTEYLRDYRHSPAQASPKPAEQLVDAKTLSHLSGEAAASLNRMLAQGKLVPAKGETENAQRTGISENIMTYASLYDEKKASDARPKYDITIKKLYYTDQTNVIKNIRMQELPPDLRHAGFGRSIGEFLNTRMTGRRSIAVDRPAIQHHVRLKEHSRADGTAMFFAETPVSAAAAQIEAQRPVQRQAQPTYNPPDTTKLKRELAEQAGKQLDDIIRKRLDVNKLTDKIYRNLEDRLRSERIRRGIV